MKKLTLMVLITLGLASGVFAFTLFRAPIHKAQPAKFVCLNLKEGSMQKFSEQATNIYGAGLTYSKHINETGSGFTPGSDPPIFLKRTRTLSHNGDTVAIPTSKQLISEIDTFEPGLGKVLRKKFPQLPALLDYEVELGFVLLEDVNPKVLQNSSYALFSLNENIRGRDSMY